MAGAASRHAERLRRPLVARAGRAVRRGVRVAGRARASDADGSHVVLKLAFRGRENEHEAAALAHWSGDGAVALLDYEPECNALLLERAEPGTPLASEPLEAALDVYADLLPRLWQPAGAAVSDARRRGGVVGRRHRARLGERRAGRSSAELLDVALAGAARAPRHAGRAGARPPGSPRGQRAPRPASAVAGDRPQAAAGRARVLARARSCRGTELGHSREAVLRRLDRLCDALGLDRDRARRWTIAQTLAWAITDSGTIEEHVEASRWLAEDA